MTARDSARLYGAHLDTAPDDKIALSLDSSDERPSDFEVDLVDAEVVAITTTLLAAILMSGARSPSWSLRDSGRGSVR